MSPMISPAPGGFEVRAHVPMPSVAVLRPEGELDMVAAPELDLRDVDLLTSNALQALLVVHNAAQRRGLRLRITGTDHGAVARVLGQTGLDAVLPITALSTEEAVAALAHPRPDARG